MRTAIFAPIVILGLLALTACSPREKPADMATSADVAASSQSTAESAAASAS